MKAKKTVSTKKPIKKVIIKAAPKKAVIKKSVTKKPIKKVVLKAVPKKKAVAKKPVGKTAVKKTVEIPSLALKTKIQTAEGLKRAKNKSK